MARTGRRTTLFSSLWQAHPVRASTMATGFVFYDHVADRWVASDFRVSWNASRGRTILSMRLPFPKRATLSAAAGFFTRSSMIRPTRRGSAITQSFAFLEQRRDPCPKRPITLRSTCLTGRRSPSKACAFLLSTARRCLRVALLMRLLSTSRLLAWATPTGLVPAGFRTGKLATSGQR